MSWLKLTFSFATRVATLRVRPNEHTVWTWSAIPPTRSAIHSTARVRSGYPVCAYPSSAGGGACRLAFLSCDEYLAQAKISLRAGIAHALATSRNHGF